jgi:hypothetical protein
MLDLSQSAYDSAMAGVEDAKIALLKYYSCVESESNTTECNRIIDLVENHGGECNVVSDILGRAENNGDIFLETTSDGEANLNQAYTCVRVESSVPDYVSSVSSLDNAKLIPLAAADIENISSITFEWFLVQENEYILRELEGDPDSNVGPGKSNSKWFDIYAPTGPAIMQIELIQVGANFKLSDFWKNSGLTTNRGTLFLMPSSNGTNKIDNSARTGFAAANDKSFNNPVPIQCDGTGEYMCRVEIAIPKVVGGHSRENGIMFLRVQPVYGDETIDFRVMMNNGELLFDGVQAVVDSTGRADDLFRRIVARLELSDTHKYVLPDYGVSVQGDILKDFWVTRENWNGGKNYGKN